MIGSGRRAARALLPALLLSGCQPGSEGALDPVEAPGVREVEAENGDPVAVVDAGALNARVYGRWRSHGAPTLYVDYRNAGRSPVAVRVSQLALRRGNEAAELVYAADMTGVDARSSDPARHAPRPLIGGTEGPPIETVSIAPGETRSLVFEIAAFPPERPLSAGDDVSVQVPLGGGPKQVDFECASASLWPF